jgi:hypothetical protein
MGEKPTLRLSSLNALTLFILCYTVHLLGVEG